MADNVLKPLMLGRGVYPWMPGRWGYGDRRNFRMFVGATLLALGYQIFMGWIATSSNSSGPHVTKKGASGQYRAKNLSGARYWTIRLA